MPPRSSAVPAPMTESAREARKSFFCELCQKGYSRQDEFANHEASYEHNHEQRRKDLKKTNRMMSATSSSKARRAEEKGLEGQGATLKKIQPITMNKTGGGFKKGGFKSAFGKPEEETREKGEDVVVAQSVVTKDIPDAVVAQAATIDVTEGISPDDEDYEHYDPRRPTGCGNTCSAMI